ncbi:hypothetical protein AO262_01760 [Pseudomonas fluorescens ABAC62]|nr:hypothetical protein AO262_01760 [Pseudomonas fluorescens ABAC62]
MGYKQNLQVLGQKLNEIAIQLGVNATPEAVSAALKATTLEVQPGSPFPVEGGPPVSLAAYILSQGLALPTRHFALTSLADAVLDRALENPLGNLGGALSWQQPLDATQQRSVLTATQQFAARHPNPLEKGLSAGVLEYLNSIPLTAQASDDPARVLETLVSSPRAQGLGLDLQTRFKGIATDTSVNDFALAGIHLVLDPESIDAPHRNKVARFNLAKSAHWGKPLSVIREGLAAHLVARGRTTAEMAKVGAHLLLARKAPALLVKDIPASVTYGSPAWVNLSIAAATIEARTPGKVANMTFGQVMTSAESASRHDPAVTEQARKAALLDWGVANNVIALKADDSYTDDDIERVRTVFNQQLNQRMQASRLIETDLPSRREIALAKLKERFGENVPFEEKLLTVKETAQAYAQPLYDPNRAPASRHSLLDIAMSGLHQYEWETRDSRILKAIWHGGQTPDSRVAIGGQATARIRKVGVLSKPYLHTGHGLHQQSA